MNKIFKIVADFQQIWAETDHVTCSQRALSTAKRSHLQQTSLQKQFCAIAISNSFPQKGQNN